MRAPAAPALVVFARAPVAGQVKTRLFAGDAAERSRRQFGRALSPEDALRLHLAFVADTLEKGAAAGFARRLLYVAGDLEDAALRALAEQHGYRRCAQAAGDLGARMEQAMAAELVAGSDGVVLIGTDSPTLPASYLAQAAAWLAGPADVVLGPAADGGYYLVAARVPISPLFAPGIDWGTDRVLVATLARLAALQSGGLRAALLPFFYDCDTPEDLSLLAAHLRLADEATASGGDVAAIAAPHTRQALAALGIAA